jgi:hypothetical protein
MAMKAIRKALQTGILSLTAVMTLIAGIPHFTCVCPNGKIKPFCFGVAVNSSGCCCGKACCASGPSGKCCCGSSGGCACPEKADKTPKSPENGYQAKSSCCTKTLAEQEISLVSTGKPTLDQAEAPAFSHDDGPLVQSWPSATTARVAWHIHLVAPPTDLVISLQHFLI